MKYLVVEWHHVCNLSSSEKKVKKQMWQNVKVGNLSKGYMGILCTIGIILKSEISK